MKLTGIVVLLTSSITYGQAVIQEGWTSLRSNGYSIQYPLDWDLDASGPIGSTFILLSNLPGQGDQFRENVNLVIQDLAGMNIGLSEFAAISEQQIKTMINHANLLKSKRSRANGTIFQKVIYTGDQGSSTLKFEQYYWIKEDKAFILTLTTDANQFRRFTETGEKILNSFKFD